MERLGDTKRSAEVILEHGLTESGLYYICRMHISAGLIGCASLPCCTLPVSALIGTCTLFVANYSELFGSFCSSYVGVEQPSEEDYECQQECASRHGTLPLKFAFDCFNSAPQKTAAPNSKKVSHPCPHRYAYPRSGLHGCLWLRATSDSSTDHCHQNYASQ